MDDRRRTRPGDKGWRPRWDRLVILVVILILAMVFWWGVLSVALHRLILWSH